jgi:DNA-binding LacI/PurR family transcriptional regulator
MKVTINDIVKESGLSYVTVSKAMRNHPSVKEENRKKVMDAMKALGYVPSAAARTLVTGKSYVIAVMISELGDGFYDDIIEALNREFLKHGYLVTLNMCKKDDRENIAFLEQKRVDGVVLMAPYKEALFAKVLEEQKVPYLIMDHQTRDSQPYSVLSDNQQGGYMAVKYLLDLGFRRIGLIGGEAASLATKKRYQGAVKALTEEGLKAYNTDYGQYDQPTGYQTVQKWFEQERIPQAIFAFDDHIALGAINGLKDCGYKVPQDVSVIGYDDSPMANQYTPQITSIKQPAQAMAKKAVDVMLDLLAGKNKPHQNTKLVPSLCIKESTKFIE